MIYKYLYQDHENRNCEGEIKATSRIEAYALLRKQGIRPYRLIGDDPWNWRPFAIVAGFVLLASAIVLLGVVAYRQAQELKALQRDQILQEEIDSLGEWSEE